jgi:probable rRNA maturation factor
MNIVITNRQRAQKINSRLLKRITETLLEDLKIEVAELGINLVAAREMTLVNEAFLRHEGPTDVITFDYSILERRKAQSAKRKHLQGEIFICVDEAVLQSGKFKTTWQSEIVRYLVHGILHLIGHDDLRATDRSGMKRQENRRLAALSKKFNLAQIGGASKLRA